MLKYFVFILWIPFFAVNAQLIVNESFNYNNVFININPVTVQNFTPNLSVSSINYDTDYSYDCHTANQGSAYTSTASDESGNIYAAYIDPQLNLKIIRKTTLNIITEKIIWQNVQNDPFHVRPSVAIDKDGESHGLLKTVFWSQYGGVDTHYQQPGVKLFFDNTNRMHIIATLIGEAGHTTTSWKATHVLYAYSDDGGNTFFNLHGQPIVNLPITPQSASVVAYSPTAMIWDNAIIGAYSPTQPLVAWRDDNAQYLVKWNGNAWVNILPEPSASNHFYMRRNGDIAVLRSYQGIYHSKDGGNSYIMYTFDPSLSSLSPSDESVDHDYFIKTGIFRFQFLINGANSVQSITLNQLP